MTRNDNASVTIDLMFAIILVISAMIGALMIMPNISHEDKDWRIKQYMTATRATDNLVQNLGESEWEDEWESGNYSNVTNIGLVYKGTDTTTMHKVLDEEKVKALMGLGYDSSVINIKWWEFPNSTTSTAERENAIRLLGLTGYNFYMQIHPVGQKRFNSTQFNSTPLETNLSNVKGSQLNTVSVVDRYVYIKDYKGDYLEVDTEVIHYRINMWVW